MARIRTMDDWTDYFHGWLDDIGMKSDAVGTTKFEASLRRPEAEEILHATSGDAPGAGHGCP